MKMFVNHEKGKESKERLKKNSIVFYLVLMVNMFTNADSLMK